VEPPDLRGRERPGLERPSPEARLLLVLLLLLLLPDALAALPSPLRLVRVDLDLVGAGLAALLGLLAAGLAVLDVLRLGARPVEEADAELPRAAPMSRFTCLVRSSILLVSRSTSVWLAVRLSRTWTCLRLVSMAFWPRSRLRSTCLTSSGGSRFCRSLTAPSAACRAWPTRLASLPDFRVDARVRVLAMSSLLSVL
jgi:hypothetical protein